MKWKQRGHPKDLLDAIITNSGMTEQELLNPKCEDPSQIENLPLAAGLISEAAASSRPIAIFGDYDVDGITATSILCRLFAYLGIKTTSRLPKRFSEGYGMSKGAIDELPGPNTLIVTVDNGIAAVDEIDYAKSKGFSVIIIDHHLPGEKLPAADIIVDPHVAPANNPFVDYCGAGLALKLAELMLANKGPSEKLTLLLEKLTLLAAIGTIADVMPLVGDNRRIVKKGLQLLQRNDFAGLTGIRAIFEEADVYARTEHEIAFKIGPILNAPGRLHDNGAEQSFELLMMDVNCPGDDVSASVAAHALVLTNEERKEAVSAAMDEAMTYISDECLFGSCPLCVCLHDATAGVVGIVAGRLAEEMKVPTFVFTSTTEPGVLKGSGRSYGKCNLKAMLDSALDYIIQGGGHEGAAGVSVTVDNFYAMYTAMSQYAVGTEIEEADTQYYDLEIKPDAVVETCRKMLKYAPFGEGNPSPVFLINDIGLVPRLGNRYKAMGKDGVHLKLYSNGFTILRFSGTEDYRRQGMPTRVNAIGNLSENQFRNIKEVQLEALEMETATAGKSGSELLDALKANGTI